MAAERVVRWQGTDESWREIVDLHDGLETVALWPPGHPLSRRDRERTRTGASPIASSKRRERRDPDRVCLISLRSTHR